MAKILIAADDLMIAGMAGQFLSACGQMRGIAGTGGGGAFSKAHPPDPALIDRRRARGDTGTEIARKLPAGARPGILYESGNISQIPLTKDDGEASIDKPSGAEGLVCRLETVAEFAATGLAATSFPRGFRVLPAAWAIAAPA